jgi:hypothetical protein
MKKIIISALILMQVSASYAGTLPEVTEKILESFKQTFKEAKEAAWAENVAGFDVNFKYDEIDTRIWYDNDGNILRTQRYYGEQKLPPFLLGKLKKKYSDKSIFGITEVSDNEGVVYYIKMEDEKNWVTIKASAAGFTEVYEKYRKA